MRTGDIRRRLVLGVVVIAAAATAIVPLGTAITAAAPARAATTSTTTETEAPDFASEVYHDAWDYSDAVDQNTDNAVSPSISVAGGVLSMVVQHGDSFSPVDTSGGFPSGRDGMAHPIDTSRYTMLSFSMTENVAGSQVGQVSWFTCGAKTTSCEGGMTFPLTAGTHVYDLDLTDQGQNTVGGRVAWSSGSVVSFAVQPVVIAATDSTSTTVSFDWMRLHAAPTASTPHAAMPPGSYGSYAIAALPEPVVDSPSPSDGQDITTAQGRQAWDFTTSAGLSGVTIANATTGGCGSDGLTATNSGQGEPQVTLPISQFDASKYHNLSFDLTYDGPFSLAASSGGGKAARLVWGTTSASAPQTGNDMVTFSTANAGTYSYDLNAAAALDPGSSSPRVGWSGQITSLRFDPNQDPGPNVWHLKDIHLRADPAAVGSTTVKFHDAAWVAGSTANVLVGTGDPGSDYTTIASGVPVVQGSNSVQFRLGSMPAGAYRVEVQITHPGGISAQSYSSDAIDMTPAPQQDPQGSFDAATPTLTGATVRGWAFDPNASSATTVALYDQTSGSPKHLADVQTGDARADVQRAVSGAPADSGWSTTVTLGSGTHTVCAYAINQPAGNNPLLGCKAVTTTNRPPQGSFDSATGTLTGATLRGWAFDPDSSSPIQVAVYDQTGSPKLLGNVTTSVARSDVQRAYPSAPTASGWSTSVELGSGTRNVCVYALNSPAGDNPLLGCKSVTTTNRSPQGSFDTATGTLTGATVRGWAFDPDSSSPIQVAIYDQTGSPRLLGNVTTSVSRPDVQRAYPSAPTASGWSGTVDLSSGTHTICVYALNNPAGDNPLLGCKSVTAGGSPPVGSLDGVTGGTGTVTVRGWAFDADATTPMQVAVYDQTAGNRMLGLTTTTGSRPDVQRAVSGAGPTTGFSASFPDTSGPRTLCVYAINQPAGDNPLLGCQVATVG